MTTYARNVGNQAVDVTTTNPATIFHSDVAAQFIVVPDGMETGATLANGVWTNPAPVEPVVHPSALTPLDPLDFYLAFKLSERVAMRASTDPVIIEFIMTVDLCISKGKQVDPNATPTIEALTYLSANPAASPILAAGRSAQISSGIAQ